MVDARVCEVEAPLFPASCGVENIWENFWSGVFYFV